MGAPLERPSTPPFEQQTTERVSPEVRSLGDVDMGADEDLAKQFRSLAASLQGNIT